MRRFAALRKLLTAALAVLALGGGSSRPAGAQESQPLRFTVKTIENEAGVRVVLEFTRKPVYEIRGDSRKIYITLKEGGVEPPFKKKDYGGEVLDRAKFAEGVRTSELVLFTGDDFSNFATFEMGEPFRIVLDLHRRRAPNLSTTIPGPGPMATARGGGAGVPAPAPGGGPGALSPGRAPEGPAPPTPPPAPIEATPEATPRPGFVVVIDAGHGGEDTGARGPSGLVEKDVTLDMARRLKARVLNGLDAEVILTRENDRAISLDERTAIANHDHADLFVCIHANSSRRHDARGAETYFLSYQATDDDARAVAAIENNAMGLDEGVQGNSSLEMVLWDLAQSAFLKESSSLAEIVQENLNDALGIANRGIKQAPFRVLMGATMPAVLIEVAFISNPEEEKRLRDAAFKDRVAGAIFDSIKRFHDKYVKTRSR
ncbi:MAG TPA: N-acetylmuramoyl-L-alanine amidase [Candidatus Polarisedimenticolia bacterium]